jgi:hypothetical protein
VRRSTRQASEQGSHCQAAAPITNKNPEASKSDKYDRNFSRATCDLSRRFWSLSSPFIFMKSASAAQASLLEFWNTFVAPPCPPGYFDQQCAAAAFSPNTVRLHPDFNQPYNAMSLFDIAPPPGPPPPYSDVHGGRVGGAARASGGDLGDGLTLHDGRLVGGGRGVGGAARASGGDLGDGLTLHDGRLVVEVAHS